MINFEGQFPTALFIIHQATHGIYLSLGKMRCLLMQISYSLKLQKLIEGCRKNDRNAQRMLYEAFYGKMMSICMRYAGNRDEASEVLNSGFLKVFTKIDKYRSEEGEIEAWIRRIMVNTAIDQYRKTTRLQKTLDLDDARYQTHFPVIIEKITAEDIMKLVNALSPAYRTVFNLYVVEGFTHKEIAEKLGISDGTSKSNLAKARKKLQGALETLHEVKIKSYAR